MKILFTLFFLFFVSTKGISQKNSDKIDSVFKFYFYIFEMETTNCCLPEKFPDYYYYVVVKKTNDTIYLNKYSGEAAGFMQKISKINFPSSSYEGPGPVVFAINNETVEKWKNWYLANRDRIKWSKKKINQYSRNNKRTNNHFLSIHNSISTPLVCFG